MKRGGRNRRRNSNRIAWVIITAAFFLVTWMAITTAIKIDTRTEVVEVGTSYHLTQPTATLFGIDVTSIINMKGKVNTEKIGEYCITYRPKFSLITFKKRVCVVDTQMPTIELIGKEIVYLEEFGLYEEMGVIAIDNYDGDITPRINQDISKLDENSYEIKYQVIDSSGNQASVTRILKKYIGIVYLTFDDGPSHTNTPQILDILKEKDVTATFFVLGFDESKNDILKRQIAEGHTIGLHGMYHDYAMIYTSTNSAMANFYSIEKLVSQVTGGYRTIFIRFPGGSSNTVSKKYCNGVMTEAIQRATEEGYIYFDWNVDSRDAGGADTAEEIYQNVIDGIRPGRENIVLMHDSRDKSNTVEALAYIIDYCIENGYWVKAIDIETTPVHHNVSN